MANREVINSILKQYVLTDVFPSVFPTIHKRLQKLGTYMVIIGGVSVEMCAKLDKKAMEFLNQVFSEDVDIKFVVMDEAIDLDIVHNIRMAFLRKIRRQLTAFIAKNKKDWDNTIGVHVTIDESLLNHYVEDVRIARVVGIAIEYVETKYRIKYPLVDTTFFSKSSSAHFDIYMKQLQSHVPVPYYTSNGVNFATCEYMMYDNCRMLVDRANYLKEKKSLFALMKFTKYVIKFMSLYVVRKKIKSLPPHLMKIYEDSYKTLLNINTFKLKRGFKSMNKIKYNDEYIDAVVSKLDTILKASNLKSLIDAATNAHHKSPL